MPFIQRYYRWFLALCSIVLVAQMWLCSGTLAPYAATLSNPHLIDSQGDYINIEADTNLNALGCYYIANYDHKLYLANYRLIDGRPKEEWNWAYLLRRPFMYVVSYPLMVRYGFLDGGFIVALLINIAVLLWFCRWVRQKWGHTAALAAAMVLCAYPATMYWSGQPYPHILITACTLALTMFLYKVYESNSLKTIALYSLWAGISFLAYDTYIFFVPAFGLLLLLQRKWEAIPVSMFFMALPLGLWLWFLNGKTVPAASGNSDIYGNIITAYLNATVADLWKNLKALPYLLYRNFFDALYFYLAIFFIAIVAIGKATKSLTLDMPFWVIAAGMLSVFIFNNMAPPYEGWQMRDVWIARIYQPAIILVLLPLFSVLKNWQEAGKKNLVRGVLIACLVTFAFNTHTNIAPAFGNDSQTFRHYNFYFHSLPQTMGENLEKYGRRPLWVCP